MDAALRHVPEVELVGLQTAGCAMFPGDAMDDPPLIIRDLPIIVVRPPWNDLTEAFASWRHCDLKFCMSFVEDCVHVRVGLYDPYLNFQVKLPLPQYQEEVDQLMEIGWVGIQTEGGDGCLVIRTKPGD